MTYKINVEKLKEDLINYFGTAMYSANREAIIELTKVEKTRDEELIQIAIDNNFDLNKYIYEIKERMI